MPFSIGKTQENLDELPEASLAKDVINKINKAHMSQRSFDLKEVVSKVVSKPLNIQVASSTRALSTDDWKVQDSDSRICELYEKIENLAAKNEWSYKQFSRQPTIQRPKTHWDNLLDEAMWMQADFVEEKKYKVSMAKTIADAVLDWHNASDKSLHVTKTFFKNDGTVNVRKKDTNVDMIPSSIFDISLKSESIAGETENNPFYENMLTYTLDNLNTENYQDIIEHGSIVPIQRLVDTFVIFQDEIPNSSLSAPFINDLPFDSSTYYSNLDFQAFSDLPLLLNKTRTNAATLTTKENAANIKSNKFEPSWNSIEDNFIRKRASELSFNWDLLATLLNNNSNLYSSQKRKAQDCSQRWSFISNTSPTNSAAQSNDHNNSNSLNLINNTNNAHDEKKRTSSRFAAFETVKKKSMKKKDTHTANSHNTSGIMSDAPSSSTQLSFINPIDLIKAKVLEDPISKRRMDQKEESTQQVQPQIQPGQPPIAISRPNTIGGRPYPVLRPGFPTNFQNIPNAMRNALGNIPLARASNAARIIAEHYQAGQTNGNNNIIQPNIPQGLHPSQYAALGYIPPNILSNPALFAQAAAAARNGGRLPQGLNNLRPSINMNQLNLNSPEGIALATHMQNTQNAILYQRALQMQHNSMINNIQNTQLPHSSNSGQPIREILEY
ncbi:hypothetical protein K502DRAFT_79209 [Neoconidiobolus thromboides FSU 785]|nr:hypothetical protein K502DRAFT_79209 [Neoconidiobolus thromboides FSU 785]